MRATILMFLAMLVTQAASAQTDDPVLQERLARLAAGPVDAAALYEPSGLLAAGPPQTLPTASAAWLTTELTGQLSSYVEARGAGGLIVWQGGAVVLERYFGGFTAETRSDGLSMHKTLAALALGIAIDDGRLDSIDQPVADTVPDWRQDGHQAITIRHLLTMSAGLELVRFSTKDADNLGTQMLYGADARRAALAHRPERPPGAAFAYNNAESMVLGVVLQSALDQPYWAFVSERLWQPLGNSEALVWLDHAGGLTKTYCCILASTRDWLRVGLLVKDRGRWQDRQLVPAGWIDQMTAPSPTNPAYGFQLWLAAAPAEALTTGAGSIKPPAQPMLDKRLVYLSGFGGQRVYVSRACDLVIVRLGAQTLDWDDAVLPNAVITALPPGTCSDS